MTSLIAARSVGPRFRNLPRAATSAGREANDLAQSAGLVLDPWQSETLEDALGERPDGSWAALEVGLIVPRQNGKGGVLEARELAGMFLFREKLILHSAHEFKTASEAFRRLLFLVQNTPDLDKRVHRVRTSHGEEGIELTTGERIRFVARSTGSGRGFSGDTVILDEAYNLSSKAMAALFPTLSARPNPQIWYTSSAPLQDESSYVLRRFCRRGREGADRVCYLEYSADPDSDPGSPESWLQANPAMGIRISEEFIAQERSVLLDEFGRERLGWWVDEEDATNRVIPLDAWLSCRDEKSGPVGSVSFALDVSPDRSWASFGVAGDSGRGGTHVELVDRRPGTDWVVVRAKELQDRWNSRLAVSSGSPAASLIPELEATGVRVEEVSNQDHARACGLFYDGVIQGVIKHLGQSELDVAAGAADRRMLGDAWLWSRRASTGDISPIVAVTLAKWLQDQAEVPQPFVMVG